MKNLNEIFTDMKPEKTMDALCCATYICDGKKVVTGKIEVLERASSAQAITSQRGCKLK